MSPEHRRLLVWLIQHEGLDRIAWVDDVTGQCCTSLPMFTIKEDGELAKGVMEGAG
jgi:hypothetical protein